jgi:hypothetical protein
MVDDPPAAAKVLRTQQIPCGWDFWDRSIRFAAEKRKVKINVLYRFAGSSFP